MKIIIQRTTEKDLFKTVNLTREAFWNIHIPGCDEHLVLHNLRSSKSYISELDLVAIVDNEIVGHIISTKAKIVDSQNNEFEALCVGPLSVLPKFQKMGIGSSLLSESIRLAQELNFSSMILYGYPEYYNRFGFRNAQEYGITTKEGRNFEPFMVLELKPNGLDNVTGKFYEDEVFVTQPDELNEFEKQFPYKEKLVTETQFIH